MKVFQNVFARFWNRRQQVSATAEAIPQINSPAKYLNSRLACGCEVGPECRYVLVAGNQVLRAQCAQGEPLRTACEDCGKTAFRPLPIIYDDQENRLLVFVCAADSETLIDEFHHVLTSCKPTMGDVRYSEALCSPFQITVGWTGLGRIATETLTSSVDPVMTIRPGINNFLYQNMFLRAAQAHEAHGDSQRAFNMIVRATRLPVFNRETLEAVTALAHSKGFMAQASALSSAAEQARARAPHCWEISYRGGGTVSAIPADLVLPRLESNLSSTYEKIRPAGYLWGELEAEVAGLAIGMLDSAIDAFGNSMTLSINRMQAHRMFKKRWDQTSSSLRPNLVGIFQTGQDEGRRAK